MSPNLEQKIRARAHQIWEQSGCVEGRADEHWRMAEREVAEVGPNANGVLTAAGGEIAKGKGAPKARTASRRAKAA